MENNEKASLLIVKMTCRRTTVDALRFLNAFWLRFQLRFPSRFSFQCELVNVTLVGVSKRGVLPINKIKVAEHPRGMRHASNPGTRGSNPYGKKMRDRTVQKTKKLQAVQLRNLRVICNGPPHLSISTRWHCIKGQQC